MLPVNRSFVQIKWFLICILCGINVQADNKGNFGIPLPSGGTSNTIISDSLKWFNFSTESAARVLLLGAFGLLIWSLFKKAFQTTAVCAIAIVCLAVYTDVRGWVFG
ncbi:hypothetical protein [Halobacteriovorax sp. CON-3]|uniref:hypothetical protein n=1 Tax=Halobacteriovorax sp. CON-3 TaxID=3157710 RepID=UPI0037186319